MEHIINTFKAQGFFNFYISINYFGNKIKKYFKQGSKLEVKISYLEEKKPLGTAGSLWLVKKNINKPIIVINGDVISNIDINNALDFHYKNNSEATMLISNYTYEFPYGVIKSKNFKLIDIEEKPNFNFYVNSGIYIINPSVLKRKKPNDFYDMTSLFTDLKKDKLKVCVFPIYENWDDIGTAYDLKKIQ